MRDFCERLYVAEKLDKLSQSTCRKSRGLSKCSECPYYKNFEKCMANLDKVIDRMLDTIKWWKRQ